MNHDLFDIPVTKLNGEEGTLQEFKGQVLLIVNTASKCGFTPQYKDLEALYREYREQGVTVLGFPCNQFGKQEPGSAEEIASFCQHNYGVSFPMFSKIEVNGQNAHPLFQHLKEQAPGLLGSKSIKWNFTKFVIDKNGQVTRRFASTDKPGKVMEYIKTLL